MVAIAVAAFGVFLFFVTLSFSMWAATNDTFGRVFALEGLMVVPNLTVETLKGQLLFYIFFFSNCHKSPPSLSSL